ncbi:TetR family transcriptional regulator [Metabacillus herbersteinensis]|uniref:TetR family transcriptional regulator n=1 Tax=Metabacillus herbersteinensis TaxID=283816 RepID=A0ABV6G9V3_9BACI
MKKQQTQNKEIQAIRVMSYFIESTAKIIEEEGIDKVTIRKIADLAGYNSATLYNYFEDLSHLIFFASMRFVKKYTDDLPHYISKAKNPLERYFLIWECFCDHSFASPQIYYAVFSSDLGVHPKKLSKYYEFYPTDLLEVPEDLRNMMLETNLSRRTRIALEQCIKEGYIKESNADQIAEAHYLIWQGILTMFINHRSMNTVQEATEKTMKHIRHTIVLEDS